MLTAWIATRVQLDSGELRTHLTNKLPLYMVPSDLMFLEALPLTPTNRKLDFKALPAPGAGDFSSSTPIYAVAATPTEEMLGG